MWSITTIDPQPEGMIPRHYINSDVGVDRYPKGLGSSRVPSLVCGVQKEKGAPVFGPLSPAPWVT